MYGPAAAATPPPPPRTSGPGAWGITVRLLFASFPVWSLGLLSWVPSLRFAVLRRRRVDWAVFGLSVALTVVYIVLLIVVPASDPDAEGLGSFFAGLYILGLVVGAVVHAILGDRFARSPQPPAFGPGPAGPPPGYGYGYPPPPYVTDTAPQGYAPAPPVAAPAPAPPSPAPAQPFPASAAAVPPSSDRMRQVASELDELDELLRKRGSGR